MNEEKREITILLTSSNTYMLKGCKGFPFLYAGEGDFYDALKRLADIIDQSAPIVQAVLEDMSYEDY